jgi:hypothetical protein
MKKQMTRGCYNGNEDKKPRTIEFFDERGFPARMLHLKAPDAD